MDSIEAYVAFSKMMDNLNFSAVGRQMGISQSTVSKHIAALEAEFGVQLFTRTTRQISPTHEASHIYEHVQRMLEAVDTVRAVAKGQRPEASGLLRVALPTSLGRTRILPLLPKFLEENPQVSVEAHLMDVLDDPLREGIEIAITTEPPRSGSLITRSLRIFPRIVVASSNYLKKHGTPEQPLNLDDHDVFVSIGFTSSAVEFDSDNGRQVANLRTKLRTNSDEVSFDMARAGQGIAIIPSWLADEELSNGSLKVVLSDYFLPQISVNLIYPQTRFLSRRARNFIDFIVAELPRDMTDHAHQQFRRSSQRDRD